LEENLTARERAHLHALTVTYPGWRIEVTAAGAWLAVRHSPPTPEQAAAGVHPQVTRPGPLELVSALTEQLGILARMRAA